MPEDAEPLPAGVMQGSGGYLTPNGGCTRAQIVTLLWRAAGIG